MCYIGDSTEERLLNLLWRRHDISEHFCVVEGSLTVQNAKALAT